MAQDNLESTNPTKPLPASLSIWPPTQRTREAVVRRLVETLTTPSSVLSKRYGVVPSPDAESAAQSIEQEAVAAVSADGSTDSVEEGIKALQLYSKVVSERLLNFAKSKAAKESGMPSSKEEESGEVKDGEDAGSVVKSEPPSA
ncbi:WPP domain-containing protein 2-like protein [Carex littledalei]|uniref:WPP domain-containing protein 2-like protein n=1 Tax=Carex littledalei TaxID=544730 RepID=A0A833V2J9_9POAL|nr:WPP domain-containing protein 2-like protein [Carex littledalei]